MQTIKKFPKKMWCSSRLGFEALEDRVLLAGDTYLVNFQGDEATTPTRYLRDTGEPFGNRSNGLTYGWSSDHTDQARERSLVPDQRFDTLVHIEANQNWEFALANGNYEVTVAVGDPSNNDGLHTINLEGVNLINARPDGNEPFEASTIVNVSDGRLTLDQGAAANKATRINYIHIVGIPTGANTAPSTPNITEPSVAGQIVSPIDVHMEAVGFSDSDGDLHKSTDWEIRRLNGEVVWQTLGIEGVERLHTHLGDGIYLNSLAGATQLEQNTNYRLFTRYRDDAGAVSSYASKEFTTGSDSTIFPLDLKDIVSNPPPSWQSIFGPAIDLPTGANLLSPGDDIIAIDLDGGSAYPGNETPQDAIDRTLDKYLNFGEINSGFIVTPSVGPTAVTSFQITTANDAEERDPTQWSLFGTNDAVTSSDNSLGINENWTLVDSGSVNLPSARNTLGPLVNVDNATSYASYRMVITGVKNAGSANSMQFAEIAFFDGSTNSTAPSLQVETYASDPFLRVVGRDANGNTVSHFAALPEHEAVRVVLDAGSRALSLPQSDLQVVGEDGQTYTIFLPAIDLSAGGSIAFCVANSGATYFCDTSDSSPDFSSLAREAALDIPFIVNRPGFVIEEVGADYRLPVNIAFVPDPGPDPDDPLYYVTELYGSIQVVTRDGSRSTFATGLLDYNPAGPISGSGEQGLTGLAVRRSPTDSDIYELYVGMLWDNGNPPGGASHYPKVERISSVAGGLSMDSRTVLLNMQPETQGQSHQISNISIGPDGKLYVHNGDGFDASTAQDLDQYRGKILRMNLDGSPPEDNPFYNAANGINARDYVFSYGLRNPFGGAWRASDGKHYQVENGPSIDRFSQANRGVNYGWDGSNGSMTINAIYNWSPASAPVNITFVQEETFHGSQLPFDMRDHAFVSQSGVTYATGPQSTGKRLTEFELDENGDLVSGPDSLLEYVGTGKFTVAALAAGPDGLYFSTLYEDSGITGPTAIGAKIYRVRYNNPLPGDYDIDGDVDMDDYDTWVSTFNSTLLLGADGNGNGIVDAADFTIWRDNLGNSLPNSPDTGTTRALAGLASATTNSEVVSPNLQRSILEVPRSSTLTEFDFVDDSSDAALERNAMTDPTMSRQSLTKEFLTFSRAQDGAGTDESQLLESRAKLWDRVFDDEWSY